MSADVTPASDLTWLDNELPERAWRVVAGLLAACGTTVLFTSLTFRSLGLLQLALSLAFYIGGLRVLQSRGSRPKKVGLGATGIVLRYPDGSERRIPWSDMRRLIGPSKARFLWMGEGYVLRYSRGTGGTEDVAIEGKAALRILDETPGRL